MRIAQQLVYAFAIFGLLVPLRGVATETSTCDPKSYDELIRCAEVRSSEMAISRQQQKTAQDLVGIAGQRFNPELNADSVQRGGNSSETNATLLFPVRLGGKRSALIAEANGEIERTAASSEMDVQQARLSLMLTLYRLAHVNRELALASEAIETYTKIVGQYERRPALSPEQDVSLSVFRMASGDYRLRVTSLKSDQEGLYKSLTALTGLPRSAFEKNLPTEKKKWQTVENGSNAEGSPQVRIASADLQIAQGRKAVADAGAWPDLRIGPSIRMTKEGGENNTYIGGSLSIPLPVLSRNEAGRSYGAQRVLEAEMSLQQTRRKASALREELLIRYTETVKSLTTSFNLEAIKGKHERIEQQFFKGLVPSALVIEAHRQIFDFEQRRNSSELEAIESLGRLLILDNKFSGVIL